MPKLSSLVSLSTAGKFAGGAFVGGLSTLAVHHYHPGSSGDPQGTEMREEERNKFNFEVQQRSEALEKKEEELKALEATLAKQQAALKEEKSAVQQMQQVATTQSAASEVVAVKTVQQVTEAAEPADVQSEKPKADVVSTDNNTPKRPAVFDGGNKEPAAPANDAQKPLVAFGSSGDVVTVGNADNGEMIDRLREEIEDLRRRLAKKDGSPKEEALRAREERLRERERALSEKLWKSNMQSKATQTDDALFEATSGDDGPFGGGFGKKAKSGKVVDFSKMEKVEVQDYTAMEGKQLSKDIAKQEEFFRQLVSVDETVSVGTATKEEQEKRISEKAQEFKKWIDNAMDTLPSDVAQTSIDQFLQPLKKEHRAAVEKNLERVKQAMPFLENVKTLGVLRAAVSAYCAESTKEKPISPQKYADLMEESAVEGAREIKDPVLSKDAQKREADAAKEFESFCDKKNASNERVKKIVGKENAGGGVSPDQVVANLKNGAASEYDALFEKENGLLKGFRKLQHEWEQLVALEKNVKSIPAAPGVPPPPGIPVAPGIPGVPAGDDPLILSDGKEDFARFLSIADPERIARTQRRMRVPFANMQNSTKR